MNDNNISVEERIANHVTTCLLCIFIRGITGESETAENVINEMMADEYIYHQIYEFLPPLDKDFFTNMIAIMANNENFCEELNKMQLSSEDLEAIVKAKVMAKLKKISENCSK